MSPAWKRRRAKRAFRYRSSDVRKMVAVYEGDGTHRDVVRIVLPHASDKLCDLVLWDMTPFPMCEGLALLPAIHRAHRVLRRRGQRADLRLVW